MFEVNEAFAAQFLSVQKELGLPDEKTNMFGGAIGESRAMLISFASFPSRINYFLSFLLSADNRFLSLNLLLRFCSSRSSSWCFWSQDHCQLDSQPTSSRQEVRYWSCLYWRWSRYRNRFGKVLSEITNRRICSSINFVSNKLLSLWMCFKQVSLPVGFFLFGCVSKRLNNLLHYWYISDWQRFLLI